MIDLSTSQGLQQYIDIYSTSRGRWLANRFNLAGKGAEKLANNVSAFVWNARALELCTTENGKRIYSHGCRIALEDVMNSPLFPMIERRFKFPPLKKYQRLSAGK